jgi:hypothetical protein
VGDALADLQPAPAELSAGVYRVSVKRLTEHARPRVEASTIHDMKAEAGGVLKGDWKKMDERLRALWRSRGKAVNYVAGGTRGKQPLKHSFP